MACLRIRSFNGWKRVASCVASLSSLMFEFAVSFYFPRNDKRQEQKNEIFCTCSVLNVNLFVRAASASMLHDCRHRIRLLHFRHLHQINNIAISTNATFIASKLQRFLYFISISSLFNFIRPQFDAVFAIRILTDMIWHRSPFIYDMIYETWLVATGTG